MLFQCLCGFKAVFYSTHSDDEPEKIGDTASKSEIITMAVQTIIIVLLIFSLIFALKPIIKDFLYRDYNKYSELIYDLRQIKLFNAKENSSSSN